MLARGGESVPTRLVRAMDARAVPAPAVERLISARTAFWITDILTDADARAYIFGRGGSLEFPFTVAAKTGTSQAYHDNWALGYTRDVTVGVWVGNFDRTPLTDSSGVTGAGPIFHDVMLAAVERVRGAGSIGDDAAILAPPPDVRRVELCARSGLAATDACPTRVLEWVPVEAVPGPCTWHHASDRGVITVWPEPFQQWARRAGLIAEPAPDLATDVDAERVNAPAGDRAQAPLTIVQPLGGAVYLLDPTLRPEFQTLALRARGGAQGSLRWTVDGVPVGATGPDDAPRWPLARGTHAISVQDAAGHSVSTHVVVR
jgi:penicillin-binding protein 1C